MSHGTCMLVKSLYLWNLTGNFLSERCLCCYPFGRNSQERKNLDGPTYKCWLNLPLAIWGQCNFPLLLGNFWVVHKIYCLLPCRFLENFHRQLKFGSFVILGCPCYPLALESNETVIFEKTPEIPPRLSSKLLLRMEMRFPSLSVTLFKLVESITLTLERAIKRLEGFFDRILLRKCVWQVVDMSRSNLENNFPWFFFWEKLFHHFTRNTCKIRSWARPGSLDDSKVYKISTDKVPK